MKQKIVGDKPRNKASDLKGVLKFQEEQIDFLFKIWSRLTNKLEDFVMKWPLIVWVYGFVEICFQLSNSVGKLAKELSDDNVREKIFSVLHQQKKLKEECAAIREKLKPARDKIGAHLFTHKKGSFPTWDEISKIYGSITKSEVEKWWSTLKKYFHQLEELVEELERRGYAAPSPQPKHISVTTEEIY